MIRISNKRCLQVIRHHLAMLYRVSDACSAMTVVARVHAQQAVITCMSSFMFMLCCDSDWSVSATATTTATATRHCVHASIRRALSSGTATGICTSCRGRCIPSTRETRVETCVCVCVWDSNMHEDDIHRHTEADRQRHRDRSTHTQTQTQTQMKHVRQTWRDTCMEEGSCYVTGMCARC